MMTAPARIAGALFGALLALTLLSTAPPSGAAPAEDRTFEFDCDGSTSAAASGKAAPDRILDDHPSGQDRSESPGGSGTQGRSNSDPDGDANGGADKPGCDGGYDDDKDGNNGCGNDDDFEDDNNGNCGKGRRDRVQDDSEDGDLSRLAAPDDPEPAPEPEPSVEAAEPAVEDPEPVVEEPEPVEEEPESEEVEEPIIWADPDADDSNDPDPDYEYPGDDEPVSASDPDSSAAPETDDPDTALVSASRAAPAATALGLAAAAGLAVAGVRRLNARLLRLVARR